MAVEISPDLVQDLARALGVEAPAAVTVTWLEDACRVLLRERAGAADPKLSEIDVLMAMRHRELVEVRARLEMLTKLYTLSRGSEQRHVELQSLDQVVKQLELQNYMIFDMGLEEQGPAPLTKVSQLVERERNRRLMDQLSKVTSELAVVSIQKADAERRLREEGAEVRRVLASLSLTLRLQIQGGNMDLSPHLGQISRLLGVRARGEGVATKTTQSPRFDQSSLYYFEHKRKQVKN
jgi:hypothetical protein